MVDSRKRRRTRALTAVEEPTSKRQALERSGSEEASSVPVAEDSQTSLLNGSDGEARRADLIETALKAEQSGLLEQREAPPEDASRTAPVLEENNVSEPKDDENTTTNQNGDDVADNLQAARSDSPNEQISSTSGEVPQQEGIDRPLAPHESEAVIPETQRPELPENIVRIRPATINGLNTNAEQRPRVVEYASNEQHVAPASYQYQHYPNWADPSLHLRIQSLPILANLSSQLLETLANGSYQETLTIVTEPESAPGQAYATLKALFDQTKRLYSTQEPFLSAHDLGLRDPEQRHIIRKANLATFLSSVFGSHDVGFYYLNEYFLETFVPDGGRLLKSQGGLYLDLKTQAYLSAMANGERSRVEILDDLFPVDLEERILSRRPGGKQLSPGEVDFVKRARSRRDHLLGVPDEDEALAALPDKYVWEDFLREVTQWIGKHFDELVAGAGGRGMGKVRHTAYPAFEQNYPHPPVQHHQHQPPQPPMQQMQPEQGPPSLPPPQQIQPQQSHASTQPQQEPDQASDSARPSFGMEPDDIRMREILRAHNEGHDNQIAHQEAVERAAKAAEIALQKELLAHARGADVQDDIGPHEDGEGSQQDQRQGEDGGQGAMTLQEQAQMLGGPPEIPYHTQTAPTQELYERARKAAMAKASPNNRRAGMPSQRRPWTQLEENALMAGLDRVKGPHWSQILAMFGAGGHINEILKDRNQVQLKDKARNLKLFFLKSGIEVPYYLQFVTGELKTRAPSQAAKNEAKERARLGGDDDRAHVEGILALAGTNGGGGGGGSSGSGNISTGGDLGNQSLTDREDSTVMDEQQPLHHHHQQQQQQQQQLQPDAAHNPPSEHANGITTIANASNQNGVAAFTTINSSTQPAKVDDAESPSPEPESKPHTSQSHAAESTRGSGSPRITRSKLGLGPAHQDMTGDSAVTAE